MKKILNFSILTGFLFFCIPLVVDAQTGELSSDNSPSEKSETSEIGQEVIKTEDFNINFYTVMPKKRTKNATLVTIYGRTTEPSTFYISKKKPIRVVKNKNLIKYRPNLFTRKFKFKTQEDGRFQIDLRLPEGQVQFPLFVKANSQKKPKSILLNFNVSKEEVKLANQNSKVDDFNNHLWGGLGVNFLGFTQNMGTPINQALKFDSFSGPEFSLGYTRKFAESFRLAIELRNSPGATSSNDSISVSKGSFNWQAIVLDGIYFTNPDYPINLPMGYRGRIQYRAGLQVQRIPFLEQPQSGFINVETNDLYFATLGMGVEALGPQRLWKADIFMRYQQYLSGGDRFNTSSPFAFEGLIGLNRIFKENWIAGLQWNGQYLKLNYSATDLATSQPTSGSSSLLHSLLEFRIGYLW